MRTNGNALKNTSPILNFGDAIYALREQQHASIVRLFTDCANRPDYAEQAILAIYQCERHKDIELQEAAKVAADDNDLYTKMRQQAYAFFTRATTIFKAIAAGHWAALEGYGYHTMYSIAAKLVRPERQRQANRQGMTLAKFRSVKEGLIQATDYQLVEVLAFLTEKLSADKSPDWQRQIGKTLAAQLSRAAPRRLLDKQDIPEEIEEVTEDSEPTGLRIPQLRDTPASHAVA